MFGFGRKKDRVDEVVDAAEAIRAQALAMAPLQAQAVQELEAYLGADYDRDGLVGGRQLDLAAQLERAAALHAAGKLTDAEFATVKGKILG